VPGNDIAVPLALKRSKLGIVLGTMVVLALNGALLYLMWPHTYYRGDGTEVTDGGITPPVLLRNAVALLLLAACIRRLRSSRYLLEVDERGIRDYATGPARLPWSAVADVTCEPSSEGEGGAVVLLLKGRERKELHVYLDGIQAPLLTVFNSAYAFWHAAQPRDSTPPSA
jgi:hypothetical protein